MFAETFKTNNMKQKTFTLEFSEQQQKWHYNYGEVKPNTHGWVTVFENCTDLEYLIIQSYLNRLNKEKYSIGYIKQSIEELKQFMSNLMEYNITIYKTSTNN
jgi:hypothetical protein